MSDYNTRMAEVVKAGIKLGDSGLEDMIPIGDAMEEAGFDPRVYKRLVMLAVDQGREVLEAWKDISAQFMAVELAGLRYFPEWDHGTPVPFILMVKAVEVDGTHYIRLSCQYDLSVDRAITVGELMVLAGIGRRV